MPDDRFLHRRAGHSQKVNTLTDLEYRVWSQYMLSADDFGVMRGTHHPLQNDNDHLANKPAKVVQRCLDRLVAVGLIRKFEHQGKPYVYQHDWQTWQKVAYPRTTNQPMPPADALNGCDEATRKLFLLHPGGAGRTRKEHSENVPETVSEDSALTRGGAPAKRLTANGSGERPTAHGASPIHPRRRMDAAFEGPRVYVPNRVHQDFLALRQGNERELLDWYQVVSDEWFDGARKNEEPGADMFRFWKARYDEKWPPAAPTARNARPAWVGQR